MQLLEFNVGTSKHVWADNFISILAGFAGVARQRPSISNARVSISAQPASPIGILCEQ